MCAKEGASAVTELVPAIVSNVRRPHAAVCQKTSYRARNPAACPLSQIVLDNLPEFEHWMKNPSDSRASLATRFRILCCF